MTPAELKLAREEAERVVKNCRRRSRLRPHDRDYYEDMATEAQEQAEMVLKLLDEMVAPAISPQHYRPIP